MRTGVSSLQDDTDYSSDEEDETIAPKPEEEEEEAESCHNAFLFGYRSASLDLSSFHPTPTRILRLWQIYEKNVEPPLKMIHVPTVDKMFRDLSAGKPVSKQEEPLIFTIYYAAVVSLEDDEVSTPLPLPCVCKC